MGKALDAQREEIYNHLSAHRYGQVRDLAIEFSDCLAIDGLQPTVLKGMEFDIELEPGAKPARAQLPKMSPAEVRKEHYHIEKE